MVDYKKEKKRKNTCRWPCELLLGGDFTTLVWIITWSFFNCPPPPLSSTLLRLLEDFVNVANS